MTVPLRPMDDRVIVKVIKKEEAVLNGLVIPDTIQDNNEQGEIVAVGHGLYRDGAWVPPQLDVGDKIIYLKIQALPFKHDGQEYFLISPGSILAVVHDSVSA